MKKFIREHTSISILKQNIEVFYNLAIKVALCIYWNLHIFKKLSNELSVNIESQINLLSGKKFTFSNKRPGNSLPFPDGQVDNIPSSQQQAPNHEQVSVGMHLLSHPWGFSRCVRECTSSPTTEDPAGVCGNAHPLPPVRIQQVCGGVHLLSHQWGSSSLDLPVRGSSGFPKPIPAFCPHWPMHKWLVGLKTDQVQG